MKALSRRKGKEKTRSGGPIDKRPQKNFTREEKRGWANARGSEGRPPLRKKKRNWKKGGIRLNQTTIKKRGEKGALSSL